MKPKYSKKEALLVCEKYKHLDGTILINREDQFEIIETVSICPAERADEMLFQNRYRACHDKEKALEFYDGFTFSVVVILKKDHVYSFKDLDQFIKDWPAYKTSFRPARTAQQ